jgi:hypothetical protein
MPLEKIITEVVILVVLQALASSFWSCIKYFRLRQRLLANYETLKTTVSTEDKSFLEKEAGKILSAGKSYAEAMDAALAEGDKVQNKRLLFLSLPIAAIIAGSYILGSTYVSINVSLFFLLAILPLKEAVRTRVFGDLLKVSLTIYRWNRENPEACKRFCIEERPVFTNIHKVITEL